MNDQLDAHRHARPRLAGLALAALTSATLASTTQAAELKRLGTPQAPYSNTVRIPPGSTIVYLAGMTPEPTNPNAPAGTPPIFGDTKTQTITALNRMVDTLKAEGMTLGDVTMVRVNLVADPAKGNVMDTAGMNEAYRTFFGSPTQPNKPTRITVEVVRLAAPGYLVEIEAQAAKAP